MKETIRVFIQERLVEKASMLDMEAPEMNDDLPLTGIGLLDSMDFFGLITDVEERFGIEIDFTEKEPAEFSTLGGFVICAVEALERR
ncbi:MAG: acyl carrier protein [Bacteroidetes bacterium]|nr:acyl carrier protein [Bacteroidota bacterium]